MRVQIKRYANRKLYNTETSRYITLSGISDLLREGREIHVVDNETGHDISALVLSRILVDSERRAPNLEDEESAGPHDAVNAPVLGELLQRQLASLFTLLRRYAEDVQGNLSDVRDNVAKWIHANPAVAKSDAESPSFAPPSPDAPDLERVIRSALQESLETLDLPSRSDFERLLQRIEDLERAIERLSKDN